ncbi:hypothetical protein V1509DRAFT_616705 [Lipomyces kononenkoae]
MDFRPLLDALRMLCKFLPDDGEFEVPAANHQYNCRRLTFALLHEGHNPSSIADDLWNNIVHLRGRTNRLSRVIVAEGPGASLLDVTSSSGRISPASGLTWRTAAFELSQSEELMRIIREWATNIFERLLLPMRLYSQIPESVKSSSSSRKSRLSRDSDVKDTILARDGMISPVGGAVDKFAPRHIRQTAPERVVQLQAAHIIPFKVAKYSAMQSLLSTFAGTSVEAILKGRGINSPSNIFCTDHSTHQSFDLFIIGIEYLYGQCRLRKIVPEEADEGPFMSHCQDGDQVIFGTGPQGNAVDLPDGELFNIHLSIVRVLHASGAGEVINNILQDEEKYNDGVVEDEASAARISAYAIRVALLRMDSDDSIKSASEDDPVDDSGILRVSTNSQETVSHGCQL